jgi:hypothetical protein
VAHACNASYLGGRNWKISLRLAQSKMLARPYLKEAARHGLICNPSHMGGAGKTTVV